MAPHPQTFREIHQIGRHTRENIINPEVCSAFRRHGILLAGQSRASPGFRFVRPNPGMVQLLACLGGSGRVLVDGNWTECRAGQAYLTPADQPHAYQSGSLWRLAWVIFDPESFPGECRMPTLRAFDPRLLDAALAGLQTECSTSADPIAQEQWSSLVQHYAMRAFRDDLAPRLWPVWQHVREKPAHPWTLKELARTSGMSEESLRLRCRLECGTSPMAQVTTLRMQHACSLLTLGLKVEYIARTVGYENPFAFSTAFKRCLGKPPSMMRNVSFQEESRIWKQGRNSTQ